MLFALFRPFFVPFAMTMRTGLFQILHELLIDPDPFVLMRNGFKLGLLFELGPGRLPRGGGLDGQLGQQGPEVGLQFFQLPVFLLLAFFFLRLGLLQEAVEGQLDVAGVEGGAPVVLADHGGELLEGGAGLQFVGFFTQDFLDYFFLHGVPEMNMNE